MSDLNLRHDLTAQDELTLLKDQYALDELLSVYPEEAVHKLIKNKDKLSKIVAMFSDKVLGIAKSVMVMKCNTRECPYRNSCILRKNGMAPDGYSCPIESKLIIELESAIVQELEIDQQNTIEMELMYDFIDAKLLDMRTSGMMAETSLVQSIKSVSEGQIIETSKDIAPEFRIKMDLKKLKASIMEEFMATRRAKKKYGLGGGDKSFENMIKAAMGTK